MKTFPTSLFTGGGGMLCVAGIPLKKSVRLPDRAELSNTDTLARVSGMLTGVTSQTLTGIIKVTPRATGHGD